MLQIIGGSYFEDCKEPDYFQLYGSGLRAICALANLEKKSRLLTCIGKNDLVLAKSVAGSFNVQATFNLIEKTTTFRYYHPLSSPLIVPQNVQQINLGTIEAENVLQYGMIDAKIQVLADYAVYDPQNWESFRASGSQANHLAIVLNLAEAKFLSSATSNEDLRIIGKRILSNENAEVVIIKDGSRGAHLITNKNYRHIPVYQTRSVWPIGSGDIFTASFAKLWIVDKENPFNAAILASKYTANYCCNRILPLPKKLKHFKKLSKLRKPKLIYLAAPFFNISERWLVNEVRHILTTMGNKVFSPLHDVGLLNTASEIAHQDLSGLKKANVVFAILNRLDAGTLFEIGYAKAIRKKVIVFSEDVPANDLTMIAGSDCYVTSDLSSAIYNASW